MFTGKKIKLFFTFFCGFCCLTGGQKTFILHFFCSLGKKPFLFIFCLLFCFKQCCCLAGGKKHCWSLFIWSWLFALVFAWFQNICSHFVLFVKNALSLWSEAFVNKHCQRHNGPEGWVLLAKVTYFSQSTRSNTKFDHFQNNDQAPTSKSRHSKHQHLD